MFSLYVIQFRGYSWDVPKNGEENRYGGLAQLGERLPCKQEVSGSIPLISTNLKNLKKLTEVPWKQETSLSFFRNSTCTLKTEHCDYDAIMRRQQ